MVMYEQCAKPANGIGPSKIFTHRGCGPQTGPNPGKLLLITQNILYFNIFFANIQDYIWVDTPLSECGDIDSST